MTLNELLKVVETLDVTIMLLATNLNAQFLEKLKEAILNNSLFTKKIIFCCNSPIFLFQLRKLFPTLICGIWMKKINCVNRNRKVVKVLTIAMSIYDMILRNIIANIVGFSLVFIHKDEFNAQISNAWRNAAVTPIAYTVNSPSEKRYFQHVLKTQYLTDSLRSEPQIIFKNN